MYYQLYIIYFKLLYFFSKVFIKLINNSVTIFKKNYRF